METVETVQEKLDAVRSWWEFAATCQFFHLFQTAYNWKDAPFNTNEFERELISEGHNDYIMHIIFDLLRTIVYYPRGVAAHNWDKQIREQHFYHGYEQEDLFGPEGQTPFFELPLRNRVVIIHNLTDMQFSNQIFRTKVKMDEDEDEESWRVEPIGTDSTGCTYWLFDDNRLYKDTPAIRKIPVSKKKGGAALAREALEKLASDPPEPQVEKWELVCLTREDWVEFPKEFEGSEWSADRKLVAYVEENVLPEVLNVLEDHEEERKRLEMAMNARRSTRVQAKELHKNEQQHDLRSRRAPSATEESSRGDTPAPSEKPSRASTNNTAEARAARAEERDRLLALQMSAEEAKKTESEQRKIKAAEKEKEGMEREKQRLARRREQDAARRKRNREKKFNGGAKGAASAQSAQEDEEYWWFSCGCGAEGEKYDDGTEMIECDRCHVWQHTACLGVESARFKGKEFVCPVCEKGKRIRPAHWPAYRPTVDNGGGSEDDFEEDESDDMEEVAPRAKNPARTGPGDRPVSAPRGPPKGSFGQSPPRTGSPAARPASASGQQRPPATKPGFIPMQAGQRPPPGYQMLNFQSGSYRGMSPGQQPPPMFVNAQSAPPGARFSYMPPPQMNGMGIPQQMNGMGMPPGMMPPQQQQQYRAQGYALPLGGNYPQAWRSPNPQQGQNQGQSSPQMSGQGQQQMPGGAPNRSPNLQALQYQPMPPMQAGSPGQQGQGFPGQQGFQGMPPMQAYPRYPYQAPQQYMPSGTSPRPLQNGQPQQIPPQMPQQLQSGQGMNPNPNANMQMTTGVYYPTGTPRVGSGDTQGGMMRPAQQFNPSMAKPGGNESSQSPISALLNSAGTTLNGDSANSAGKLPSASANAVSAPLPLEPPLSHSPTWIASLVDPNPMGESGAPKAPANTNDV